MCTPGKSICGKAATKWARKVLKSSPWAHHFPHNSVLASTEKNHEIRMTRHSGVALRSTPCCLSGKSGAGAFLRTVNLVYGATT